MNYYDKNSNSLQSTPAKNLLIFPDEFIPVYFPLDKRAAGFVAITDDGETVTSCEWNEEAYQTWCAENPEPDYLAEAKAARIAQSKADLAAYLESHPILWTDGLEYSITAEKQSQLMGKLFAATIADSKHEPYDLTWNSTGEVCKSWELADLTALAFAIDARVTSLVSYQQTQEVAMRNAATQEALEAIVVDYDSVSGEVSDA